MSIDHLIKSLDAVLVDPTTASAHTSAFREFLSGTAIADHVRRTAENIVRSSSGISDNFDTSDQENPAILYNKVGADGAHRRLVLRSQGNTLPFHSTFPDDFVILAMAPMVVDELAIVGAEHRDIYATPGRDLRLRHVKAHMIDTGNVIVRNDPSVLLDVNVAAGLKYLVYIKGSGSATYQLAFARDTLECVATSMTDVASTKAIAFLEVLEGMNSVHLPDIAFRFTDHYSPIVRWRSLSSLNRARDPRTRETLERFTNDKVAFVRDGARRALARGAR